jgi:general secretion pathway protein B
MSYILDALKRSQEERELGSVPTLSSLSAQQEPPRRGHNVPWVLSALLLAVVAVAVSLYALLRGEGGGELPPALPVATAPAVQPPPTVLPTPPAPVQTSAPPAARKPPAKAPAPPQPVVRQPSAAAQPRVRSVVRPLAQGLETVAPPVPADLQEEVDAFRQRVMGEQEPATTETAEESAQHEDAAAASPAAAQSPAEQEREAAIPRFRALPSGVQSQIPPHRISVHVYVAEPARRFVILDSQRMAEGDRNDSGLRLEEIRPDGVVLSYGAHRFFAER